jgi:hypothetical protein
MRTISEVKNLLERGALVELAPSPIIGWQAQHYQAFSSRLPARFGFFDTLIPLCHLPWVQQGVSSYTVVEENAGRDAAPKMLTDLLHTAGWKVEYEETSPGRLLNCVRGLIQSKTVPSTCKIVKCSIEADISAHTTAIEEALQAARSWVGGTGLLALLSDIQPARVERFVNINNFLAEMGVIERDLQKNMINWSNSLAYFAGHGQLWINSLGRDPQGAVHPQDAYEEVCNTLVKALPAKLRDAETGAQVIERVYHKEELYSSEYLFCTPDLMVVFKSGYAPSPQSTCLEFDEQTFTMPAVVPTLLHGLNVEYTDMDSPTIDALFTRSYLGTHTIRTNVQSQELSEEDEELVINRLRDLGYI